MTSLVQAVFKDVLNEEDEGIPFVLPISLNVDQLNLLLRQHLQTETTFQLFLGSFDCPIRTSIENTLPPSYSQEARLVILYQPIEEGTILIDEDLPSTIKCIRGGFVGLFDGSLYKDTQLISKKLHKGAISSLIVNGESVTTGSLDCTIKTGKRTVSLEQTIQCMHQNGEEIYAGLWDGRLAVIGKKTKTYALHKNAIVFVQSLGSNDLLCTASWDYHVTLWKWDGGQFTALSSIVFPHAISCGCVKDKDGFVFGHPNGSLSIVQVSNGATLQCTMKVTKAHAGRIAALCATGSNGFASAGEDGSVKKWQFDKLHTVWSVELLSPVQCLDYFDGKLYVGRGSHLTVYQ